MGPRRNTRLSIQRTPQKRRIADKQRGAAVAELAVCIPIVFVVVFGAIEACDLHFLRQALVAAAYEGALLGSQQDKTEAEIIQRVQTTLSARNITVSDVSVNVQGSNYDSMKAGRPFTVHIEAPLGPNAAGPTIFATSSMINVDVVGHKQ